MGLFVNIIVDQSKFLMNSEREKIASICPVDIFRVEGKELIVKSENEDECTFCFLCLQNCPNEGIRIEKTYQYWLDHPHTTDQNTKIQDTK